MARNEEISCSFCGRKRKDVRILIAGMTGHICENCVEQAQDIIRQNGDSGQDAQELEEAYKLYKPSDIKSYLDEFVIGQEEAKKVISVAVYNHYKRLLQADAKDDGVDIEKTNILLIGETGTGKTLIAKTIAKLLNVPFCIADATILTEAGYVGEDVESILSKLLQAADFDVSKAERGIVFIDEVDKIARKGDNASITRDVSGEGVQQALLKLLEGSEVNVPPHGGRKHPEKQMIKVNTKNILFIAGGAFAGIDRFISRRLNSSAMGFKGQAESVDSEELLKYVSPRDVRSFGLIPELIGRFPLLSHLNPLDEDALRQILTEPKNAITKQYIKLFAMDGVDLSFESKALDFIVSKASEYQLGARGLRSICEAILNEAMFEIPGNEEVKELVVTLDYARSQFDKSNIAQLKVA